ncbi:hypothetical protein DSLASN_27290 [Desulfoluna limicola]|uniref:VanZ-like domain-containing protein n=1 Tax=Desulfoluna limicola TaxID=2810562 RepID=A0ABN6F6H1_9BACT|nr:hypothetical protein DSLASN_27290 [Desulfoluna limicola]
MCLSLLGGVFLFVGGPDSTSPRSFQRLWDSGHIVLFFLWASLLTLTIKQRPGVKRHRLVVSLVLFSICLGAGIELIQVMIGRTFSWGDVMRDVIGTLLAVAVFLRKTGEGRDVPLVMAWILIGVCLMVEFTAFARVASDEVLASLQFPVLSNFETPFEADRWGKNSLGRSRDVSKNGDHSLKVRLLTTPYSGVGLTYFPEDWRGFKWLTMGLYKQSPGELELHVRVHDAIHTRTGNRFRDRYNETFTVHQGWNDITVETNRIRKAPADREMDMKHIQGLGIFAMNLDDEEVIYIDDVALTGRAPVR